MLEKKINSNNAKIEVKTLLQFSDKEFEQYYLGLMKGYGVSDGWWNNGNIPKCKGCHKNITGPEQLRRYRGDNFDPICFKELWSREMETYNNQVLRKYFDRVAGLSLGEK